MFYSLWAHYLSAWTGKQPSPLPASSGWSPLPGGRDERRLQVNKTSAGWEDRGPRFTKAPPVVMMLSISCLHPPVASLSAPWVKSLPPPPPHCPDLGSSSVCCKLSVLPVRPPIPGRHHIFLWFFVNIKKKPWWVCWLQMNWAQLVLEVISFYIYFRQL